MRRLIGKGISPADSSKLLGKSCVAAVERGNEEVLRLFLDMEREVEKEKEMAAHVKRDALRAAVEGECVGLLEFVHDLLWETGWSSMWKKDAGGWRF